MISNYTAKLGLKIWSIDVWVQKIDDFISKIIYVVLASFQIQNKLKKFWFFQKTFLIIKTSIKLVSAMVFLNFSYANILFI